MKINQIEIQNFKRFTDLTISNIPETSKLVLIIGSNGSGKSCLFDAFDWLSRGIHKGLPYDIEETTNYYKKSSSLKTSVTIKLSDDQDIEKIDDRLTKGDALAKKFIGRSSIRIVPRIFSNANPENVASDLDSPLTYTENDSR